MITKNDSADKAAQKSHLEENRRFTQNALEMVLSLGDFQKEIHNQVTHADIFIEAESRIKKLIPFETIAFYSIDQKSSDLIFSICRPSDHNLFIEEQVEFLIDKGFIAWAIRERRGVVIFSKDHQRQMFLHVIATYSRILGFFMGVFPENHKSVPDVSYELLSIVLRSTANAIESIEHSNLYMEQRIKLKKSNRTIKLHSECNKSIVRGKDESDVLNNICRVIVENGNYRFAWIGFTDQNKEKTVHSTACHGFEEGYIDKLKITWADDKQGRGPTGSAIRTGKPCIAKNILTDPNFHSWRTEALRCGYASSIAIPLIIEGKAIGALNIYAEKPDAFDADEVALLTELGNDVSYGIINLRTQAARKRHEQELKRLYQVQQERVKELHCLNSIAESIHRLESLEEILRTTVQLIPPGWQYPEITKARIVFDTEEYISGTIEESAWRLSSEFLVRDKRGIVEVFYTEKRPAEDEGPFLKEERTLLDSIAQMFGEAAEKEYVRKEKALLEEQYRQAQKMESVGRLAGGVAHDYNNALSVIMGFTELAMGEVDPTEPLHDDLNEVLKAARRAASITRQLLTFARKQTITPIVLNLNKSLESMLKMLQRLIGEDIDLVWLPGTGLWSVKMDPSQIDQILANLCVNSRDAISGVGKVTIETHTVEFDSAYCADHPGFVPGEFVLLSVSDNGCGMDKETRGNIFEPFFTTKDVDKGTGLGLATVYGIVKQNNGFINVYSKPGKGTIIKIYLPRHEGNLVKIQKESTMEIPPGRGETVLVTEDDPSILKFIRKTLEEIGYTVLSADTPGLAMAIAKEHTEKIHLLVTDVILPEMNGRELAEQLQSLYPSLKCIFMSGYTADVIAHHGVLDEGVYFLQKPFFKRNLMEMVRKVLDEVNGQAQE